MHPLTRPLLAVLIALQVFGGGSITLAHARDVADAPPGIEASHDARCAVLHNELRCALCHYAGARVVMHQTVLTPGEPAERIHLTPAQPLPVAVSAVRRTAPARAPPLYLS